MAAWRIGLCLLSVGTTSCFLLVEDLKPSPDASPGETSPVPETLSVPTKAPEAIARSGAKLVWSDLDGVSVIGTGELDAGSAVSPTRFAVGGAPRPFVLDADHLFFMRDGKLERADFDGANASDVVGGLPITGGGLAIEGPMIYWTQDQTIHRVDASDPSPQSTATIFCKGVAITGALGELVVSDGNAFAIAPTAIVACLKGGAKPAPLAPDGTPSAIAMDATHILWTASDGTVSRVVVPALDPQEVLASKQQAPRGLFVDDSGVYWSTAGGTVVWRKPDGALVTVVADQDEPWGITSDATHLYWVNKGSGGANGSVNRIAKFWLSP